MQRRRGGQASHARGAPPAAARGAPSSSRADQHSTRATLLVDYEELAEGRTPFADQRVLVVGAGNSAFQVAQALRDHTAQVTILGRTPPRFACETHYVGDVRAVHAGFLDRYLLKSLDVLTEFPKVGQARIHVERNLTDGKLALHVDEDNDLGISTERRTRCDTIIRATGFEFDDR